MKGPRPVVRQTISYFGRPHQYVPSGPINHPAAWYASDLDSTDDHIYKLSTTELEEIQDALNQFKSSGLPTERMTKENFQLNKTAETTDSWRKHVCSGQGILIIKGLQKLTLSHEDYAMALWGLGLHIGNPGEQNLKRELLTRVENKATEKEYTDSRLYHTDSEIEFHCDAADMVALLCIRNESKGGESLIASSITVFNEFLEKYPNDYQRLFSDFYFDLRDEGGLDYIKLKPLSYAFGDLKTFFHFDYFKSVTRHQKIKDKALEGVDLISKYNEVAKNPKITYEMTFEPGDIQLISNHHVIHGRRKYQDSAREHGRLLYRMWLSNPEKQSLSYNWLHTTSQAKVYKEFIKAKIRKAIRR